MSTVSPIAGHFCIRFSREEEAATVSPILGPLSSASPPAATPWIPPVLCHLYLAQLPHFVTEEDVSTVSATLDPVHIKSRDNIEKKFNILPASAASQALQNPVSLHRTRQS